MKKLLFSVLLFAMSLGSAGIVGAASLSFSTDTAHLTKGDNLVLSIKIDPHREKIYTAKISIVFPPEILEATSFSWGQESIPLVAKGYDQADNKRGILIKTAGFPQGIDQPITFGTIIFNTKATGPGIIRVADDSFILNAKNLNTLDPFLPDVTVVVTAKETKTPPPPPKTTPPSPPPTVIVPPVVPSPAAIPPLGEKPPLFDVSIKPAATPTNLGSTIFFIISGALICLVCFAIALYLARRKKQ